MSIAPPAISTLSFLTPGNFPDGDPFAGLEQTLRLFELGERLGFDGAWIRQRHLEHGVGSAAVFLAAASQRTRRVELGTAVIPIGYESPFRLAEDLSMADVLSGGRLQVGLSAGVPPHADLIGHLVFDGDWRTYDLSYGRISRLLENLRGDYLGDPGTVIQSPGTDDFTAAQLALLADYRQLVDPARPARVALGRVIVPLDGADPATRQKYRDYAASRHERTLKPQGERQVLFAPDVVGTAEQILEQLHADAALAQTSELRLELPYEFHSEDYEQILHDTVTLIGPELGWAAAATTPHAQTPEKLPATA